jgi:hypothetical protein
MNCCAPTSILTIIRLATMANTSMIFIFQPCFVPRFSRLVVRYKAPRIQSSRFNLLPATLFHSAKRIPRIQPLTLSCGGWIRHC